MKILLGTVDVGYRINTYKKIAEKIRDVKVYGVVKYKPKKSQEELIYDHEILLIGKSKLKRVFGHLYLFIRFGFTTKVFHFISGETLLPNNWRVFEYSVYKVFGKKIITHFVGNDIRPINYLEYKANQLATLQKPIKLPIDFCNKRQKQEIENANRFSDAILVSSPDLLEVIPKGKYIPLVISNELFNQLFSFYSKKEKSSILVSHLPSNIKSKGTKTIEKLLSECKLDKQVKTEVFFPNSSKEIPKTNLLKKLAKSHIVVDQMSSGWFGMQTLEALILGCQVLCYIEERNKPFIPSDCPIYFVNPDNFQEVLQKAIFERRLGKYNEERASKWVKVNFGELKAQSLLNSIWFD